MLAALRLKIGVRRIDKRHRLRAEIGRDDRLERDIDDLTQREVVGFAKRLCRKGDLAEFTDVFIYACHRDPSWVLLTLS